jgi:acyl-CoA thioesterase
MTQLTSPYATDVDRTTALMPVEGRPGEFVVDLDAGWSSLVGTHGGCMSSLAVRAAESLALDRSVRTASTSCLRSGRVGPAELSVREVRRGRSISTMVAELVQDNRMPFTGRRACLAGYVRPLEGRPVDAAWLMMAADCFPPPAFAQTEAPIGGMSIDMTVHVHRSGFRLQDDAWPVGSFVIDDSAGGLAVEHGPLTRMDGAVVAESFQTRLTVGR